MWVVQLHDSNTNGLDYFYSYDDQFTAQEKFKDILWEYRLSIDHHSLESILHDPPKFVYLDSGYLSLMEFTSGQKTRSRP